MKSSVKAIKASNITPSNAVTYPAPSSTPAKVGRPTKMNDGESIINAFLMEQDVKESSRNLYAHTIKQFFGWVKSSGRILNAMERADIIAYKEDLLKDGHAPLTVGSYLQVVRNFYAWAEAHKIYPNIANGVKSPKKENKFMKQHLEAEQCTALLNAASAPAKNFKIKVDEAVIEQKRLRNFAIINLILRTGLRTIEVINANIADIRTESGKKVLYVMGKGRNDKSDFVVLTEKAFAPIAEYLKTRPNAKQNEALFVSDSHRNKGGRLHTRTIRGIAKEYLREIGIDDARYTAHSLRHTTAVQILENGGSIFDVQMVLRHLSPATSEIYTASIKDRQRLKNSAESLIDAAF